MWPRRLLRAFVFVFQPFNSAGKADDAWATWQPIVVLVATPLLTYLASQGVTEWLSPALAALAVKPGDLLIPGVVLLLLMFVGVVKLQIQAEPRLEVVWEPRPPYIDVSRTRGDDGVARETTRTYSVGVRNASMTQSIRDVSVRLIRLHGRGETTGDTDDTRQRFLPIDRQPTVPLHPGETRYAEVVSRETTPNRTREINVFEAPVGPQMPAWYVRGVPVGRYELEIAAYGQDATNGSPRRFRVWVDGAGGLRFEPVEV